MSAITRKTKKSILYIDSKIGFPLSRIVYLIKFYRNQVVYIKKRIVNRFLQSVNLVNLQSFVIFMVQTNRVLEQA